jgi:hypothetical protein
MKFKTEVSKLAPIWTLKFIFLDMQKFAHQIAVHVDYIGKTLKKGDMPDRHISQIVQHLNDTTRCLLNYSYVNNITIVDMKEEDYVQPKVTWDMIETSQFKGLNDNLSLFENYSDRCYMYCLLLWNCAQQALLSRVDVYNETIDAFFEWMVECSDKEYSDESTQPLFRLISQLGYFKIYQS